ncbi:HGGxSTG domain-containing protein [Rhodomicrobium sp.]|uniref:HGGxSTG domain-containing protein n=1 Tax=Rhodomicrobium sp. TaxID=2720632 RepID=UPI0039E6DA9C
MLCGARTRAGTPCRRPKLPGRSRCRNHGGLSTGPKSPEVLELLRQRLLTLNRTPEARARLAARNRSPEARERQRARMLAYWAARRAEKARQAEPSV